MREVDDESNSEEFSEVADFQDNPPQILFLTPSRISETTKILMKEAKKRFSVSLSYLNNVSVYLSSSIKIMDGDRNISYFDYVFPKIDGKRKEYGVKLISAYDMLGVKKPYNAASLLIAHDKFMTTEILASHGLNVPRTMIVKGEENLKQALNKIGIPLVMKLLSGSGGQGVIFIDNEKTLESLINSMEHLNQVVIVQEYVPNAGEDIRSLVVGGRVIGAYKRVAKPGEKRSNIKLGGRGEKIELDEELEKISIKSAKAIGSDICGVDIIEHDGKYYVLEVNLNPGIRGMMNATGINIAKEIIDYIYDVVKK